MSTAGIASRSWGACLVALRPLAVVALPEHLLLLTTEGELAEQIDLTAEIPAPLERIGRIDGLPVLESGGTLFVGDAEVTAFDAGPGPGENHPIPGAAGPLLLDFMALGLIVPNLSGVFVLLWGGKSNGLRNRRQ